MKKQTLWILATIMMLSSALSFANDSTAIAITTNISSLLNKNSFPHFSTKNLKHGVRMKKDLRISKAQIDQYPAPIVSGNHCSIALSSAVAGRIYDANAKYAIRSINDYDITGHYIIEMQGPHIPSTMTISCENDDRLTFQDIENDLAEWIEFF